MSEYEVCDLRGELQAVHVRRDTPDGKDIKWRLPDGTTRAGLRGRPVASLPLYGSQYVPDWPLAMWIVVTEGESDCDALMDLEVPALATVTGAAGTPSIDALHEVAPGRRFILWPDNDDAGRAHMVRVGENLYRAGATSVFMMVYSPSLTSWPEGAGARDLIGLAEPLTGKAMVTWMVEEWADRVVRPGPIQPVTITPRRDMGDTGSVSDALIARGAYTGRPGDPMPRPGRTVRCLTGAHKSGTDRHPSLSILRDDLRAICKSGSCPWSGRGVIASDVLQGVSA